MPALRSDLRALESGDAPDCERILRELPEWFGLEASIREYVTFLHSAPGFVFESDSAVAGFVALRPLVPGSAEIEVMAVRRDLHRGGHGRGLVAAAEQWCRERAVRWLVVKTRGPSAPDPDYEQTRAFYTSVGFEPILETVAFWGPEDPALVFVKPVLATGEA